MFSRSETSALPSSKEEARRKNVVHKRFEELRRSLVVHPKNYGDAEFRSRLINQLTAASRKPR